VLLISHDRAFLDAVVDHVLHFEGDTAFAYQGNYQRFIAQRAERRLALEHCVLLHHGPELAAGRRFASAEALALYRVNALDAHVKGALELGLQGAF